MEYKIMRKDTDQNTDLAIKTGIESLIKLAKCKDILGAKGAKK